MRFNPSNALTFSRTGSSGDTKLSELDEMVLDIIGRDSAGVRGLQVPDSDEGRVAEENFAEARNVSGTGKTTEIFVVSC